MTKTKEGFKEDGNLGDQCQIKLIHADGTEEVVVGGGTTLNKTLADLSPLERDLLKRLLKKLKEFQDRGFDIKKMIDEVG